MEASKIKEIIDLHKLWIETNGKQGEVADLIGADLRDANLTGADLTGSDLTGADLTYASLVGADLTDVCLEGANLTRANLSGTKLSDTNLSFSNLTGANFNGAYLVSAYLYGANLTVADLTGANLWGANLTGAIGVPDVSWIEPGCLVQLKKIRGAFFLERERKYDNFVEDTVGFIIKNNIEEETFDILIDDKINRSIPDWVKLSGLRKINASVL